MMMRIFTGRRLEAKKAIALDREKCKLCLPRLFTMLREKVEAGK
jgi:hypothetical protein